MLGQSQRKVLLKREVQISYIFLTEWVQVLYLLFLSYMLLLFCNKRTLSYTQVVKVLILYLFDQEKLHVAISALQATFSVIDDGST